MCPAASADIGTASLIKNASLPGSLENTFISSAPLDPLLWILPYICLKWSLCSKLYLTLGGKGGALGGRLPPEQDVLGPVEGIGGGGRCGLAVCGLAPVLFFSGLESASLPPSEEESADSSASSACVTLTYSLPSFLSGLSPLIVASQTL